MHIVKDKVSVLIPTKNERFLEKTTRDILSKAHGDIEIIINLDGYWPDVSELVDDKRVIYIHKGKSQGMRQGINNAASIATGEYLLKSDAHCMYADGFDEVLKKDMEENWIVIPRRKRLEPESWSIMDVGKPDVDYELLCSPASKGAKGMIWTERIMERLNDPKYDLDENLSFQGSCWFTTRKHFVETLGMFNDPGYGTFVRESQEIGLKTWLGGGKVMINKKTWYAHLHKGKKYGRGYFISQPGMVAGEQYCDDYWFNNRYPEAIHDLAWLIERFGGANVPSWTPELIEQVRKK